MGSVRAVLQEHTRTGHPRLGLPRTDDPNAMVPVADFTAALDAVQRTDGEAALRRLAHDYIRLWARTFRTLVKHLRGRPDRTLDLFCTEVYPFLRGDRRAARVQARTRTSAQVLLAADLPAAYLSGLLEAFVELSGASAKARTIGPETFEVTFHLHPRDAAARTLQWVASLRLPLLMTATMAVLIAASAATAIRYQVPTLSLLLVLAGAVSAQSGANAIHDLRRHDMGPLDVPATGRGWKWFQVLGSYAVAASSLTALVLLGHAWLLLLAAAGLILSFGYAALRNHGLGPALAAVAHGPLVVAGAFWVLVGAPPGTAWFDVLLLGAAPGLLTAAMLYLDDMADRPLDEAGGSRTLAVRLPSRSSLVTYATMLGLGVLSAVIVIARWLRPVDALWLLPSAGIAAALVRDVRRHLDRPRELARSRFVTLALHFLTTLVVITLLLTEIQ